MKKPNTETIETMKDIMDEAVKEKNLAKIQFADGYMVGLFNAGYYTEFKAFLYLLHSTALEEYVKGELDKTEEETLELNEAFMEVIR